MGQTETVLERQPLRAYRIEPRQKRLKRELRLKQKSITALPMKSGNFSFWLALERPRTGRSLFWTSTRRSMQGGNLLADDRILRSFVYVDLGPMSVVLRHISVSEDCFDGTFRHARIAVNASVGVDVKTIR